MTSFTVGTADFRAALQSVVPHASPDPDEPIVHRVRLSVGGDVTVTATNRYTAACALVSIEENHHGELDAVDLLPVDVKEVLALFKVDKDVPDQQLRIDADSKHVTVTDSSGLFDGKSYRLLRRQSVEAFPDIPKLMAATVAKPPATPERLVVNGQLVKLFVAAATAYQEPLTVEPTGDRTSLVLACGESFIGLLMPMLPNEDRDNELDQWRRAWKRRLPVVSAEQADQVAVAVRAQLREAAQDLEEDDQEGGDES